MISARMKYNLVYNVAKAISERRMLYENGCMFVDNKLTDPAVSKAFERLAEELEKQLTKIRKELRK